MTDMADAIYDLLMIANFAWERGSGAKDSMLKPLHSASCLTLPFVVATGMVGKLKVG